GTVRLIQTTWETRTKGRSELLNMNNHTIMRIIPLLILAIGTTAWGADPNFGRSPYTNRLGTNVPRGFTHRPAYTNLVRPGFPPTNRFHTNFPGQFTNRIRPLETNVPSNPVQPPTLTPPANPEPPRLVPPS